MKTASLGYFKKPLDKLTLKEITMLVALPRAPSFYDPTKNLEFSLSRANDILRRLYSLGWISSNELKSALNEVPIVYNQTSTQNIAPYVVDEVLKQLDQLDGLKTQGYTIKLTIDLDYQRLALESLRFGHQKILEKIAKEKPKTNASDEDEDNLNASMIVTETSTGKILALVGGIDYKKALSIAPRKPNGNLGARSSLLCIKSPLIMAIPRLLKSLIPREILKMAIIVKTARKTTHGTPAIILASF